MTQAIAEPEATDDEDGELEQEYADLISDLIDRVRYLYPEGKYNQSKVEELQDLADDLEEHAEWGVMFDDPSPLDTEELDELVSELAQSIEDPERLSEKVERYEDKLEYRKEKLEYHEEHGNEDKEEWNCSEIESLQEYRDQYKFLLERTG